MRTMKELEALIKEHGYNLLSFSAYIDVPKTTIYNLFRRNKDIENASYRVYRAIANGLGMSSDELYRWMHSDEH